MIFSNGVKICGITLNRENCKGCVLCMRKCPTEAIRVRGGKARIIAERCVSCGECVRACPTGAKNAVFTPLSEIEKRKYKIAVPCPSIYGQFNNLDDINHILCGLIDMGFSKVAEVAVGCEIVSEAARAYLARPDTVKPVINTSCPAVVKLIQLRFSQFLDHLLPVETPEEITAAAALEQALGAGYKREDIGVYIISPCSAKVEALAGNPNIDGVLAFSEVYFPLLQRMNASKRYEDMAECGRVGLGWGVSGGEAAGISNSSYLAADGIENVISVLNELDHDKLNQVSYMELNACPAGCVGGVLNTENPFLATARIRSLKYTRPITISRISPVESEKYIFNDKFLEHNVFSLSSDRFEALKKFQRIGEILKNLPGIDCGSCGAPSCRAFAEDVVNGVLDGAQCRVKGMPKD